MSSNASNIKIINNCSKQYLFLEYIVKRSIKFIGQNNFDGLSCIVLEDANSLSIENLPDNIATLISQETRVFGYYSLKTESETPFIKLFVHEIYRGLPFPFYLTPIITLRMLVSLAHEISHHLIAENKLKFSGNDVDEEIEAWNYSKKVLQNLKNRNRFIFWHWCLREISSWYLAMGRADYSLKNLERAASNFHIAAQFDLDNVEANRNYWLVKKEISKLC